MSMYQVHKAVRTRYEIDKVDKVDKIDKVGKLDKLENYCRQSR